MIGTTPQTERNDKLMAALVCGGMIAFSAFFHLSTPAETGKEILTATVINTGAGDRTIAVVGYSDVSLGVVATQA